MKLLKNEPMLSIHSESMLSLLQRSVCRGYHSLKLAQPVEQLVEASAVLPSTGTLSNQRRIRGEYHTLSNTAISLAANFSIVKLNACSKHTQNISVCTYLQRYIPYLKNKLLFSWHQHLLDP